MAMVVALWSFITTKVWNSKGSVLSNGQAGDPGQGKWASGGGGGSGGSVSLTIAEKIESAGTISAVGGTAGVAGPIGDKPGTKKV